MPGSQGITARLRRWLDEGRTIKDVSRRLVTATSENDLLTYASAVCYQIIFALAPVMLAGLAVLGFLNLEEVWDSELAPRLRQAMTDEIFGLVDGGARSVLESRNSFWLTIGVVLALWYISGATRALMGVMNRIYATKDPRSFRRRMGISILLSVAVAVCFGLASVAIYLSPALIGRLDVGFGFSALAGVIRWALTLVPLYVALLLFVRYAPAHRRAISHGSLTSAVIVGGWVVTSFIFRWYVTSLADYESLFGNLASIIIAMGYLYLSSMVLIYGLQLDALVRQSLGDDAGGGDTR
ncbi:MAG: YihY/virulence factor BrkB family protein [Candidatus Krumholzibacteriia bacterium]